MKYFVYMVTCSDGTIYTGYTKDILKRLEQHNSKSQGARYTKTRQPVKLSFVEIVETQREAILRELEIKKLPRKRKMNLINGFAE
ncbi:MAG: GIY-YIG nuclease family protein [Asgard group archaeon]|nr:GIY-YIG nuclease family protein [Asgard group archaeon]